MSTSVVTLINNQWTDLGYGPMTISAKHSNEVGLNFGVDEPDIHSLAYHDLHGPGFYTIEDEYRCWARSLNRSNKSGPTTYVVVTGGGNE